VLVSKREKYIAIGTISAIVLLLADTLVIEPYWDGLKDIGDKRGIASQQLADDGNLLYRQAHLQTIWSAMKTHGLKTVESQADSQLQHAIYDWSQQAGVTPQTLKSDQPRKEGDFQVIGYRVTASGSMLQISRLIWALETATIPIRVSDIRVTPEREGTDQLSVQLGVSTLCAPASQVTPAPGPATPAAATKPMADMDDSPAVGDQL
jgi:Type II secretion system (T2SS), protein M subtype b